MPSHQAKSFKNILRRVQITSLSSPNNVCQSTVNRRKLVGIVVPRDNYVVVLMLLWSRDEKNTFIQERCINIVECYRNICLKRFYLQFFNNVICYHINFWDHDWL